MTERVTVVEVGARDGLQNENTLLATADKLELLRRLCACGLTRIEATACVSPKRVAQMGDYPQLLAALPQLPPAQWSVLVANERGLRAVLAANAAADGGGGVGEIALFTAASDAFTQKNINCTVAESLRQFAPLAAAARSAGLRVRGYVSAVIRCPYAGGIRPAAVAQTAAALLDLGCDEISLGDTLGIGTPATVRPMLAAVLAQLPAAQVAVHFHDTYGCAVANIACALDAGIRTVDASVGGLGGCPFAPAAGGNVAGEDVVHFLAQEGFATGVDLSALTATGKWICKKLNRPYTARAGLAAGA